MIRFGLRLAFAGGREALTRLAVVGAAVAIGVGLLLSVVAGTNAVHQQDLRYSWLNSMVTGAATGPEAPDSLWFAARLDYFRGDPIARVDVAANGPQAPVPPGVPRLPGPGEYYASPALADLLRSAPADQLADRYPGRRIGEIGEAGLPSPASLIVLVGRAPQDVAVLPRAHEIRRLVTAASEDCDGCYLGINANGITLILAVVGVALLFPLLVFIGTATRLSTARREQRFAAMRLVGATGRQVVTIATVESTVAALAGTLGGFALFLALRPALARVTFTSERFFLQDISLTWYDVIAVAAGVPLAAAVAAALALRRVRVSPLGVTRRVTPRPPRAWRVLPLLAGLGELAYLVDNRPHTTNGQLVGYLSGILVTMAGLMVAGPYLTLAGSRLLARRANRPATVIAARRLADDPRTGFRAVSGLALALFVTSVATGVITTLVAERGGGTPGSTTRDTLVLTDTDARTGAITRHGVPAGIAGVPGVHRTQVIYKNPLNGPESGYEELDGLITCADLAAIPGGGTCPPGATVVTVFTDLSAPDYIVAGKVWPRSRVAAADVARQPAVSVLVATDGSARALEQSRTLLERAYPELSPPSTEGEWRSDFARQLVQFQKLADVVVVASLVVAGCSLAVSITGGLNERRRPFAVLRLTGMRLAELRRVVTLESAVPMLAVSAVAIAAGFAAAALFVRSQLQYRLHPPGAQYYVFVILGLGVSLALIASTMPLLRRITGPEGVRNE